MRVLITSHDHSKYGETGEITGASKIRGEIVYSVQFRDGAIRFVREGQFRPTKVQGEE